MRAGLLRVVLTLLFVFTAFHPSSILAQSSAASAAANAVPANSGSSTQPKSALQAGPSDKFAIPGCSQDSSKPSDADKALQGRKYPDAERLYGAALQTDPTSTVAMAGLVRTTLAEGKLAEALAMAQKYDSAHANDAVLLDALSEVRFRRGETDESGNALNRSLHLNPCSGLTRYDLYRFLYLNGLYRRAQTELERAYWLAPQNTTIAGRWRSSHAVPQTSEQRLASLKKMLDNPALPDPQKDAINVAIKSIQTNEEGSCQLVAPITETRLPIAPIPDNGSLEILNEAGLDVQINGKKKRLEIDTGASGLILSNSAARSAGLTPELQIKTSGIGDNGPANAYVTHVNDIKIGKMEFKNCMVKVLAPNNMVEQTADMDGLIGMDVFRDYVVTLDYPGREVRLGPLPKSPDEAQARIVSLSSSGDEELPVSIADSARDRYIAPEMKDWTPVFRSQHMLIFPTYIGKAPVKLFLMDSGSGMSIITPEAAKEVSVITDSSNAKVQGISGEVQKVKTAQRINLMFANVMQTGRSMITIDNSVMSRNVGVEISGIIGFPILRELVISIDYRDNLVHVIYDPKKGYHAHNDNQPTDF